ncbi:Protein PyrBI [Includes: Aspartate carbamoyltransferase (Aspartate transcarbamylase) (ATCase) [Durusdinium trenchii]|uniref:Protein PyrBI n=1 Tax=Durusdinium trenchii TaxID=1381693 RepID=A0ABP0R401_9DINO
MMASVAPGCTFNCVNDSKVVAKYRLQVPERIYNLPNISCKNSLCVSNPVNRQREIVAYLERVPYYVSSVLPNCTESEYLYVCKWCRWPHVYENIWDDLRLTW